MAFKMKYSKGGFPFLGKLARKAVKGVGNIIGGRGRTRDEEVQGGGTQSGTALNIGMGMSPNYQQSTPMMEGNMGGFLGSGGFTKKSAYKQNYSDEELGVTSKTADISGINYDELNWRDRSRLRREMKRKKKAGVPEQFLHKTPRPNIVQRIRKGLGGKIDIT